MTTHLAATAIDRTYAMNPQTVILRQIGAGSRVGGRWVPGAAVDTEIAGCFWQMKADEQRDLPDDMRRDDMRVLWTRQVVKLRGVNTTEDKIIFMGNEYDLIKLNERFEGAFFRAVCGRNNVRSNSGV